MEEITTMAKNIKAEKIETPAAVGSDPSVESVAAFAMPEGFVDLASKRAMWNPQLLDALLGYPIEVLHITPKDGTPFDAIVMSLTRDCVASDDDDDKTRIVLKQGEQVLIPVTDQIRKAKIDTFASEGPVTFETYIQYTEKKNIGGGKTLKLYKAGANMKKPVPKSDFRVLDPAELAASAAAASAPALAAPNGIANGAAPFQATRENVPAANYG